MERIGGGPGEGGGDEGGGAGLAYYLTERSGQDCTSRTGACNSMTRATGCCSVRDALFSPAPPRIFLAASRSSPPPAAPRVWPHPLLPPLPRPRQTTRTLIAADCGGDGECITALARPGLPAAPPRGDRQGRGCTLRSPRGGSDVVASTEGQQTPVEWAGRRRPLDLVASARRRARCCCARSPELHRAANAQLCL